MDKGNSKLDQFLEQHNVQIYSRERFIRSRTRKNPIVNVDYSSFLDEQQRFKKALTPLILQTIQKHDLKIYFIMVSWYGRGDKARWTGSHLFKALKKFRRQGLCELFLSYQEGDSEPSSLCAWCRRNNIEIFYADQYQLVDREGNEIIVPQKAPGKAENVIKSIKWIESKSKKDGRSPNKVLVVFVDDDYTQQHWINYYLLFAPWVLSFIKKTGDEAIDHILKNIKRVSFIKSGSPRIILPYELQSEIVNGHVKPMGYLDVTMAIINLAISHQLFNLSREKDEIAELLAFLQKIRRRGKIYTPQNRVNFLSEVLNNRLEQIWREYIYRGGRVTQRLEGIFRQLSHKNHCRWLRQFTFLLHGDQAAPLSAWLEFSPFSGYALEISLLIQTLYDKAFEGQQVLNVIGLPHSHRRSKELAIWHMFDTILLAFDLTRIFYKDLSTRDFLARYRRKRYLPMIDRYGTVIQHAPQYGEMKIYPPLKYMKIE